MADYFNGVLQVSGEGSIDTADNAVGRGETLGTWQRATKIATGKFRPTSTTLAVARIDALGRDQQTNLQAVSNGDQLIVDGQILTVTATTVVNSGQPNEYYRFTGMWLEMYDLTNFPAVDLNVNIAKSV